MELIYKVKDRPSPGKIIVFALQQLLSIIAGTVTLPLIVGNGMSQSAALFGAALGTLIYLIITKFKSPVFLGSSFTYLGSMASAFAGAGTFAITQNMGFLGLLIGAILAGLVYVVLSIIVHLIGSQWVDKIMPPVIIGPIVAIIALTLAPNAMANIKLGDVTTSVDGALVSTANEYICILCGLIALFVVGFCAVHGKGMIKLIPLFIGILVGYLAALIFTIIGNATNTPALMIINFDAFKDIKWIPDFSFIHAFQGIKDFKDAGEFFSYFGYIAALYVPVAFAVFAEHIADHKNISHIIGDDLLRDPGLSRTLMGDGVGSIVGAFFGGCPNTTYGESISCVAFSKNASIITIVTTTLIAIVISFFGPLMTFFSTIPKCVVGGISIALYGFIAISGFQMLRKVDIRDIKNILVVATIFILGIGSFTLNFTFVQISPVACALVGGILMNLLVHTKPIKKKSDSEEDQEE